MPEDQRPKSEDGLSLPLVAHFSFIQPSEWGDLADDIRQLFDELAQGREGAGTAVPGTCRPLVDVFETDEAIELVVDAAGVPRASLRVLFRQGVVVVAGEKTAHPTTASLTYHLVERDFGRFARVVRVNGAFDVERASATLRAGELTVVLPKRIERRGQGHRVPVRAAGESPG
jgi:HSP20 family protein